MSHFNSDKQKVHLSSQNPSVFSIVEKNIGYYSEKWEKHRSPLTYSGWNWAAFLFTPAWLAYRHMYTWTFVFFSLYFLSSVFVAFIPYLIHIGWLSEPSWVMWTLVFPLLINIFFGLKGNALYTNRIIQLIQMKENQVSKPSAPLFNKTGTSWVSAFIVPILISFLLIVPTYAVDEWTFNPDLPYGAYIFSDNEPTPAGILDVEQNPTFLKYDARINFLYYGEKPVDNQTFEMILFYKDFNEENNWTIERERSYNRFSSNRITLNLIDAENPVTKTGDYRLEIYIDENLEEEAEFSILPPN
ncbi:DUF2628 domain-containing protein [Salipaludibacillus sp. HK11]|uniref:DUF2628 domain-containing protein n=1 Tax=Salipaludibacillus sp. HK11 TaxID=3394320 RepID=UPI0039FC1CD4